MTDSIITHFKPLTDFEPINGLFKHVSDFPRGCLMDPPDPIIIGWISVSDVMIAIAYFVISSELLYFYLKTLQRNVPYKITLILFVLFIVSCGLTHVLKAVFFYHPLWKLQAGLSFFTGIVSLVTAVYLFWVIPQVLNLPNQVQDLEQNLHQRDLNEDNLRENIISLTVLRQVIHQLRTANDKRSLITSLSNAIIRTLGASAVYVYIDSKLVYGVPSQFGIREIDVLLELTEKLQTTTVAKVDIEIIRSIFNEPTVPSTGTWYAGLFTDSVGWDTKFIGYIFVYFESLDINSHATLLPDVLEQFEASLRLVNLIELDQQRLRKSEEQNESLVKARKETQVATQVSKEWIYIVSHEIRTPLFAVVTLTSLILDRPIFRTTRTLPTTDEKSLELIQTKDDLEIIKRSGDALMEIVETLLDFSRIDAKDYDLSVEPFSIHDVFEMAVENCTLDKDSAPGPKVHLVIDKLVPFFVVGDPLRVRQLIIILVSNSIKYTPSTGAIMIHVKTSKIFHENVNIQVNVIDNGSGIQPDKAQTLFTEFVQTESPLTRRKGGTGLGLAIAKKLVMLMEGTIKYMPNTPHGSNFEFNIQLGIYNQQRFPGVEMSTPHIVPGVKELNVCTANMSSEDQLSLVSVFETIGVTIKKHYDFIQEIEDFDESTIVILDVDYAREHVPFSTLKDIVDKHKTQMLSIVSPYVLKQSWQSKLPVLRQLYRPFKLLNVIHWLNDMSVLLGKTDAKDMHEENIIKLSKLRAMNILIIDDDKINRIVLKKLLMTLGQVSIDFAVDGIDGFEKVSKNDIVYDVIFMDIMMPNMDGFTCTRKIREWSRDMEVPWIICITAAATNDDRLKSLDSGMNDFIAKPATNMAIQRTLANYISRKRVI